MLCVRAVVRRMALDPRELARVARDGTEEVLHQTLSPRCAPPPPGRELFYLTDAGGVPFARPMSAAELREAKAPGSCSAS